MTTPRIDENWQSKFLNKGTELGCGDLSIMIGTVSEILDKVKDEAHQAGIDEGKEEQKQRDVFLVRTSGWHVAEKLARKLLGGNDVKWYTQEQLDKAIEETNRSWREDPMTKKHYEELVRKAVDPERIVDKVMAVFLDMWPRQVEITRHIMNEARAKLEERLLKP